MDQARIADLATEIGFTAVRVCRADEAWAAAERLSHFVAQDYHGTMAWMEETLERRQKMAEARIAQAEAQASAEVKAAAADLAAKAAEQILAARLAGGAKDPLLDAAIAQIGDRLN